MADNTRYQNTVYQTYYGQEAASQANRTNFTPGKATASASEMNWPKDYPIFTISGAELKSVHVTLTGRNIVCDKTIVSGVTMGRNSDAPERNSGYLTKK